MTAPSEPVVIVASAEFTLKSSAVRRTMEQRLVDDLRTALTRAGIDGCKIEKQAGRIIIHGALDPHAAAQSSAKVFGVAYAAPAVALQASMEMIVNTIVELTKEALAPGQSFAIRAHRSTPSPLSRREVEIRGGSEVLRAMKSNAKVDLNRPDVTVFVDLADDRAYVYREKLLGPGGLPLSSDWKLLAVLDSGPLTILAAYAMMRRGCLVELFIPVSDALPLFNREYQLGLARTVRGLVTRPSYKAFTIEVEDLFGRKLREHSLALDALKRSIRAAAYRYAKEKRYRGIVLANVAGDITSQLFLADVDSPIPIFQPLIGLEREDLVELCHKTGIPKEELLSRLVPEQPRSASFGKMQFPEDLTTRLVQRILL